MPQDLPCTPPREPAGCPLCWPESAAAAWQFRQQLRCDVVLIDQSHFRVQLLRCPACSQHFLSVFTEVIDWQDGNDDQDRTVLPLTEAETAQLLQQEGTLDEGAIQALGKKRPSLRYTFPRDAPTPSIWWGVGVWVGMHD